MDPLRHGIEDYPRLRFKGGGGDPPEPQGSGIGDTPNKRYARETLYPNIVRGMEGQGYGPSSLTNLREASTYEALDKSYDIASSELKSNLSRAVKASDTRVKNYATSMLSRDYLTAKSNIANQMRDEKLADQDLSMGLAADVLGQEQRMSIQGASMYNQALTTKQQREQQYGTFGTNLAGGAAEGLTSLYFARGMAR